MTRGEWALVGACIGLVLGVVLAVLVLRAMPDTNREDEMIAPKLGLPEPGRAVWAYYWNTRDDGTKYLKRRPVRMMSTLWGDDQLWLPDDVETPEFGLPDPDFWGEMRLKDTIKEAYDAN